MSLLCTSAQAESNSRPSKAAAEEEEEEGGAAEPGAAEDAWWCGGWPSGSSIGLCEPPCGWYKEEDEDDGPSGAPPGPYEVGALPGTSGGPPK